MAVMHLAVAVLAAAVTTAVSFDQDVVGQVPAGWTATRTGSGSEHWSVERDESAPSRPLVLKQAGTATYPLCYKNDTDLKDGFVEVKFKPVSGKEDQAAGVVWRLRDANTYYVARANALENNVTIYDVLEGRRVERGRANLPVRAATWHTLRVDFAGTHFVVSLDGKRALEWNDGKIAASGHVGLWTKADSVTLFDDFSYGGT